MNPAAFFEANKPAVLGVAAAGVAGLALWQRKRSAAPATSAGPTTTIAGTSPAAAVVPAGSYDSSSYDLYNALQPEIDAILAQQRQDTTGSGVDTAPTPVASTLLAPSYNGNYVRFSNGAIDEVESDGSLLHLSGDQLAHAGSLAGGASDWIQQLEVNSPDVATPGTVYNSGDNLLSKQSQFKTS